MVIDDPPIDPDVWVCLYGREK